MIDFEWYRSFISIYKHRSVSAAAKARILTQPAMSQHLAALEAEIGEPLFIRAPRKMIPTDKGKELYTKIVPLIENLENTTLQMLHSSSGNGRAPVIRIGSPVEYFTIRTLPKIRDLNIRFLSQFGVAGTLLEKLEKDEVDLILTTQKMQQQGIEYQKLEDEVFVAVVPQSYETSAGNDAVEIERWLNKQNWLSYGLELPIIRRYWRDHFKKRPDFQPCHVIPDLRSVLEGIENELGMSILPTYLIEKSLQENRVKVLFPELTTENTIYVAYKVEQKNNPVLVKVLEALKRKN
ncbi:LysR family transcriptional regulator [Fictibacillus phosphorivorans]|uniref:LysR family transcriptional regulator n=1 Tax=Fictibacillus phosphorivorans TaxID=1221500 RepID=UPI001293E630|nr:LysR family transcriptional regulator [Fictibacillus phosphorivorans]MQR97484.1 LysR family transcriptional regulator [Fictibacillus phosphorivorans]